MLKIWGVGTDRGPFSCPDGKDVLRNDVGWSLLETSKLPVEVLTELYLFRSFSEPSVCMEWGRTGCRKFSCQQSGLYPAAMCVWVDPWHQRLWRRVMRVIRSLGKLCTRGLWNSEGQPPSKESEWESALIKVLRAAVHAEGGQHFSLACGTSYVSTPRSLFGKWPKVFGKSPESDVPSHLGTHSWRGKIGARERWPDVSDPSASNTEGEQVTDAKACKIFLFRNPSSSSASAVDVWQGRSCLLLPTLNLHLIK